MQDEFEVWQMGCVVGSDGSSSRLEMDPGKEPRLVLFRGVALRLEVWVDWVSGRTRTVISSSLVTDANILSKSFCSSSVGASCCWG